MVVGYILIIFYRNDINVVVCLNIICNVGNVVELFFMCFVVVMFFFCIGNVVLYLFVVLVLKCKWSCWII